MYTHTLDNSTIITIACIYAIHVRFSDIILYIVRLTIVHP